MFVANANLLKKVRFPRICLPSIALLSALLNFLISFVVFIIFLLATGTFPGPILIEAFPLILLLALLAISLGTILGVFNVYFRDVAQLVPIALSLWFWFTPIVYTANILPVSLQRLITINPIEPILRAFQDLILLRHHVDWIQLLYPLAIAGIFSLFAYRLFARYGGLLVDEL